MASGWHPARRLFTSAGERSERFETQPHTAGLWSPPLCTTVPEFVCRPRRFLAGPGVLQCSCVRRPILAAAAFQAAKVSNACTLSVCGLPQCGAGTLGRHSCLRSGTPARSRASVSWRFATHRFAACRNAGQAFLYNASSISPTGSWGRQSCLRTGSLAGTPAARPVTSRSLRQAAMRQSCPNQQRTIATTYHPEENTLYLWKFRSPRKAPKPPPNPEAPPALTPYPSPLNQTATT